MSASSPTPHLPPGWLPSPPQLEHSPQLAVLVALHNTLDVTARAIEVAHPEIDDDPECPYWVASPDRLAAEKLLALIYPLRSAIACYHAALPQAQPADPVPDNPHDADMSTQDGTDDDIPFQDLLGMFGAIASVIGQ